jgi:membrane-bound lytic murein transglycosylase B
VANYFHQHRWERDGPIATRATLDEPGAGDLATRGLDMEQTVATLREAGVTPGVQLDDTRRANLLMLETSPDGDQEHWVTLHNFFVITRYNRSPLYSIAVHKLAQAISERRDFVDAELAHDHR